MRQYDAIRKEVTQVRKRLKLKAFRALKGLSQAEFAEKIGCTRSRYTGIETGRRDGSPEFWAALQNAFGIPDAEMWGLMSREENEKE